MKKQNYFNIFNIICVLIPFYKELMACDKWYKIPHSEAKRWIYEMRLCNYIVITYKIIHEPSLQFFSDHQKIPGMILQYNASPL